MTKTGVKASTRGGSARPMVSGRHSMMIGQQRSRVEVRGETGQRSIRGYGAVFYRESDPGTEYWLWDDMVERIRPSAFDRAISEKQDVRGLYNHSPNALLGRTTSGTLRLSVDSEGLAYEIDEDSDDPDWQRVAAKVDRGDLTGSSFAFMPQRAVWEETPDYWIRWIEDVDLYDVGPVTFPAYDSASSGRSEDYAPLKKELSDYLRQRNQVEAEPFDIEMAARMAEIEAGLT